jgi:hypothetical protein
MQSPVSDKDNVVALESFTLENVHAVISSHLTGIDSDIETISNRFEKAIADSITLAESLDTRRELLRKKINTAKRQMANITTLRRLKRSFEEANVNVPQKTTGHDKAKKSKSPTIVESDDQSNGTVVDEEENSSSSDSESHDEEGNTDVFTSPRATKPVWNVSRKQAIIQVMKKQMSKRDTNGNLVYQDGVKAAVIASELGVPINHVSGTLTKLTMIKMLTRTGGQSPAKPFLYKLV